MLNVKRNDMQRCKDCIYDRTREWMFDDVFYCESGGITEYEGVEAPCVAYQHRDYPKKIEI